MLRAGQQARTADRETASPTNDQLDDLSAYMPNGRSSVTDRTSAEKPTMGASWCSSVKAGLVDCPTQALLASTAIGGWSLADEPEAAADELEVADVTAQDRGMSGQNRPEKRRRAAGCRSSRTRTGASANDAS